MPQDAAPLSEQQVTLIRRWIEEGATWAEGVVIREKAKADTTWWSLQPLGIPRADHSIDTLVSAKLDEQELVRNPPADRATLIRRATFDLTGLPPTPEDVASFVADPDPRRTST